MSAAKKKARKVLTPREVRTFDQLCDIPRDNVSWRGFWFMAGTGEVTICKQSPGKPAEKMLDIPRATFERFIDWYNTGEMPKRSRSASPTERRPEE